MHPKLIKTAWFVLWSVFFAPGGWGQTVYPKRTTIWERDRADNGNTLFVAQGGFVVLVDMEGHVVHRWVSPIPGHVLSHVDPLDNGHILVFTYPEQGPPQRRTIAELDDRGRLVWLYSLPSSVPSTTVFHHDSERLPNGNTMILAVQSLLVPSISSRPIEDDFIMEVDPAGNVVWEWQTWEHFNEFGFDVEARSLISEKGGDWAHANSIAVIPPNQHGLPEFAAGNVIVSQRFTNTIFIIDRQSGRVAWQMGPEDDQVTHGQHFPYMIPLGRSGAGNILVFDNGSGTGYPLNGRAPGFASVPEIDPLSKQVVWRYNAALSGQFRFRFSSYIVSGAQRLPNGNTLICSGVKGRLFEVDPAGQIVWEYMSPFSTPERGTLVYRAYRVPYDWGPGGREHR